MSEYYLTPGELREEVGKALGLVERYAWGVDDYRQVADAATRKVLEALKAKGTPVELLSKDITEFVKDKGEWQRVISGRWVFIPEETEPIPDDKGQS